MCNPQPFLLLKLEQLHTLARIDWKAKFQPKSATSPERLDGANSRRTLQSPESHEAASAI
ncbi:LRR receptor-like serine/threonine-protein kinase [Pyrus ussuriensis x Pyrus communis]|uniref:LRR receptor-like serine/threonine-protein kinase n=1 Tax=Pyrus ussuriensis x Pyrus communis TaxID=2448454 RepID=A0A5N5F3I0_9ROSA|nr:LRR receptor-like serine/threonine-protein kinase [Pyrus ussuriensis x Pyrus communis]